jgi:hypothetical protein
MPRRRIKLAMFLFSRILDINVEALQALQSTKSNSSETAKVNDQIYALTQVLKNNAFVGMLPGQSKEFKFGSCIMKLSKDLGVKVGASLVGLQLNPD